MKRQITAILFMLMLTTTPLPATAVFVSVQPAQGLITGLIGPAYRGTFGTDKPTLSDNGLLGEWNALGVSSFIPSSGNYDFYEVTANINVSGGCPISCGLLVPSGSATAKIQLPFMVDTQTNYSIDFLFQAFLSGGTDQSGSRLTTGSLSLTLDGIALFEFNSDGPDDIFSPFSTSGTLQAGLHTLVLTMSAGGQGANGITTEDFSFKVGDLNPVPVPAAFWLFGTALIGLVGFSMQRKAA